MAKSSQHRRAWWAVLTVGLALGAGAAAPARADAPSPLGFWVTETNEAVIEIHPCDDKLCGRLVRLKESDPTDAGASPKDVHNPDPDQRDYSLCGLEILHDFSPKDDGVTYEGSIYNARDGQTYNAEIAAESDSVLKLHGYLLLPLLGQTRHWTRLPPDDTRRCQP